MLRIVAPLSCRAEREYILSVVFDQWLGVAYRVEYADVADCAVHLPNGARALLSDAFLKGAAVDWLAQATAPDAPLARWRVNIDLPEFDSTAAVPVLFADAGEKPAIRCIGESEIVCTVDLIGGIFFLISRYEEVVLEAGDSFGRFPAAASVLGGEGLLGTPLANEYLEVLWLILHRLCPSLRRKKHRYRICLSHDVDSPSGAAGFSASEFVHAIGGDLIKRKSPVLALKRTFAAASTPFGRPLFDPHDTFDFIMDESERRGLQSEFYFICGHSGGRIDGVYDIEEPWVVRLLSRMVKRGHRLGLHPSFETWRRPDLLRGEFERLKAVADGAGARQEKWGGRQHFLRWKAPETWVHWSKCGLDYDSSLGYAEQAGFRCGTCYEFPVYDVLARSPLQLIERPLIVMEASLLQAAYMGLTLTQAVEEIGRLAQVCRGYGGVFSLLWHNHFLIERSQRRAYREALEMIA